MSTTSTPSIEAALTAVDEAVAGLLDALQSQGMDGIASLSTDDVLQIAVRIEGQRNCLWATDRALVTELNKRGAAE